MTVQNQKYRIGGAHGAWLGSAGIARFEEKNIYERQLVPDYVDFAVQQDAVIDQKTTSEIEAAFKGEIREYKAKISAEAGAEVQDSRKETVTYHAVSIADKMKLITQFNSQPALLGLFKSDTVRARVITGVLLGYGHQFSSSFSGNANITLESSNGKGNFTSTVAGGATKDISFSDGTILAYVYDRACWGLDANGNAEIKMLLTDNLTRLGDPNCPPDTVTDWRKLKK